jgi:Uncharacterised nucleotidyltransferase/Transglutaminase-like superfamily
MSITAFLIGQDQQLPIQEIRDKKLGGWAYARMDTSDPQRSDLRPLMLMQAAKHGLIRRHLIELISHWNSMDLEPLLFKGFALAEFVYTHSYERYYGDVDLLLPRAIAPQATRAARAIGWIEVKSLEDSPELYRHEYNNLLSEDRVCRIDFHTDVIQGHHPDSRRDRFSQTIYEAAERIQLGEAWIRLPNPVDFLILTMISRRWGERWAQHVNDYLDAGALIERFQLTRETVLQRAQVLRCEATICTVLERCDVWRKHIDLSSPSLLERWFKDWRCSEDFGMREWERFSRIPAHFAGFRKVIWPLVKAYRARAQGGSLYALVSQFDRPLVGGTKTNYATLESVQYGMNWAQRLSPIKFNPCVPRSLALLQVLSEAGFATSFVSGVRRLQGKLDGHAWLEVDGIPLEIVGDTNAPQMFKENFRYDNWVMRQRKANNSKPSGDA